MNEPCKKCGQEIDYDFERVQICGCPLRELQPMEFELLKRVLLSFNRSRNDSAAGACVCDPTGEGEHKGDCPEYRAALRLIERMERP